MTPEEIQKLEGMQTLVARLSTALSLQQASSQDTGPTVRELFDCYMDRHGNQCKNPKVFQGQFRRHLGVFAARRAHSLKAGEVNAWHARLSKRISKTTANHALQLLRAVFNKAISWEMFDGPNPCRSTSEFHLESRDRYLNRREEMERFVGALHTMPSETFRNFVLTCLYTAARKGNVQAMRWEDIDLERCVWRIPMTKSGKPVVLPLIPEALSAIEAQSGKSEVWVFPGRISTGSKFHNKGHFVAPAGSWRVLCEKAGIEDLRMHDLRRTMASWQVNTGASLQIVQKTLGHSNINATQIYARLQIDPVRESMEKAAKAMHA